MDTLFFLSPTATLLDLQDGIDERIRKVKAILYCLMFATENIKNEELGNNSAYYALWAIDNYIDEINCLGKKIYDELINNKPTVI